MPPSPNPDSYSGPSGKKIHVGRKAPLKALAGAIQSAVAALGQLALTKHLAGAAAGLAAASGTLANTGGSQQALAGVMQSVVTATGNIVPEVVGDLNASFTLTSAASGTKEFCLGHAFKQGEVPSGFGVTVTGATAQITPKNLWPDNSMKFAIVCGSYASTGGVPSTVTLTKGTSPSGTALTIANFKAVMTQPVTVDAGAFGSASWSGTDWDTPFETWASGHRMSSWVYRKQIGSDPHLVAWLEVRFYDTNAVEILPWIENGYFMTAGPTSKSATYAFTMGGTQRFSVAIDLPHHCRTPLLSGTATSHWLGTDPGVTPLHDTDYMQSTGLVPAYYAKTPSNAAAVTALPSSFAPLQLGSFPASGLGGVGGNTYVGLLPQWDVLYLTCPQASTYKSVIFNGYSVGRYPIHYREDPTFGVAGDRYNWPRLSNHTTFDFQSLPANGGTAPPAWSGDHQPSVGYLAYLITGRRYHLDTVQASNVFDTLVSISGSARQSASGGFPDGIPTRMLAWCWRNVHHALAVAPNSTYETEYRTQLKACVDFLYLKHIGTGGSWSAPRTNKQGFVQPYSSYDLNLNGPVAAGATTTVVQCSDSVAFHYYGPNAQDGQFVGGQLMWVNTGEKRTITAYDTDTNTFTVSPGFSSPPPAGNQISVLSGIWWDAIWMHDYLTASMGWALDIGPNFDATTASRLSELFKWKAQNIVGRLGFTGATEFFYREPAPYAIAVAPFDYPNANAWANGTGPWYADWGQIYSATYGGTSTKDNEAPWPYASRGAKVEGDFRNTGLLGDPTNHNFLTVIPAIAYAKKHAAPGAEAAYQRLISTASWSTLLLALDASPGWAVAPEHLPKWRRGQAVDTWVEIPGSSMASFLPTSKDDFGGAFPRAFGTDYPAANNDAGIGGWLVSYCGMGVDTLSSTVWQIANGGHGDYYGNEVIKLDLMKDAPAWIEWFKGSSGLVVIQPAAAAGFPQTIYDPERGWYLDDGIIGRAPASGHSYWCTQSVERFRRMVRFPSWSMSPSGTGWKGVDGFKITVAQGVKGWDAQFTFPGQPVGGYSTGNEGATGEIRASTCKDPRTECVYCIFAAGGRKWTPPVSEPNGVGTGGSWSSFNAGSASTAGASAVDTKRGRLFVLGDHTTTGYWFDIDAGTMAINTITLTGAAATTYATRNGEGGTPYGDGWAMVYSPELDAYLVYDGRTDGSEVFKINASTFAVTIVSPANGASVPVAYTGGGGANAWNRFQRVPRLRGIVWAAQDATNLWFWRTH